MELHTTERTTTLAPEVSIVDVWRTLKELSWMEQPCPLNNSDMACDMFDMCLSMLHTVYRDAGADKQRGHERTAWNGDPKRFLGHAITMQLVFIVGITAGTIVGGLIVFMVMIIGQACARRRKQINNDKYEPRLLRNNAIRGLKTVYNKQENLN